MPVQGTQSALGMGHEQRIAVRGGSSPRQKHNPAADSRFQSDSSRSNTIAVCDCFSSCIDFMGLIKGCQ